MPEVSIDFETRSPLDLKQVGAHRYAEHPNTRVICMAWAIDQEEPELWWPWLPFPPRLAHYLKAGCVVNAWNAQFERLIWPIMVRRYGAPPLPLEQWRCTMVRAFLMGFPGKLENAGPSMGLGSCKDTTGHRVMLQVSKPRKVTREGDDDFREALDDAVAVLGAPLPEYEVITDGDNRAVAQWWVDNSRMGVLGEYCIKDVVVEREAGRFLDPINDYELAGWRLDQRINDRGFHVDMHLALIAKKLMAPATKIATRDLQRLTGNPHISVTKPNDIRAWLNERLDLELDSISKDVLELLLIEHPQLAGENPADPLAVSVIKLRLTAAKTSTAKLNSLIRMVNPVDLVRGALQYAGAGRTNRWCLAEGTEVLCRKVLTGEVLWLKIEDITTEYLVHDGNAWVTHDGVVSNGEREVMTYAGLTATPQHIVWVSPHQKMTLAEAESRGLPIWKPDTSFTA